MCRKPKVKAHRKEDNPQIIKQSDAPVRKQRHLAEKEKAVIS